VTTWSIHLASDRTAVVEADEVSTRQDGSAWFLRAEKPPPNKLSVVLVIARGEWRAIYPADSSPLPEAPKPPERVPRFT
jgi:hypothetical protein